MESSSPKPYSKLPCPPDHSPHVVGKGKDELIERQLLEICFNEQGQPDFHAFAKSKGLYFTKLDSHGLLLSIIDGVSQPAPLKYQTILDVVQAATDNQAAYWVTILFHDNMVADLVSVRVANLPWRRSEIELFECQEGVAQGGQSFLALVSEGMDWILWHCYDPCNDFTITFYGSVEVCEHIDGLLAQRQQAGETERSS